MESQSLTNWRITRLVRSVLRYATGERKCNNGWNDSFKKMGFLGKWGSCKNMMKIRIYQSLLMLTEGLMERVISTK